MALNSSSSEDYAKESKGSLAYVWTVALIASIGGLLYGYVLGVISGAVPFITDFFGLNDFQVGLSVSMIDIGGIVGSLFAGYLSDKYGRKKILIFTAFLFAISAVLTALPNTFGMLVFGRFIGGTAVGASMISALYTAEIAPARMRGILVSLTQFGIVVGIVLTYLSNWLLVDIGPDNWRWMFGVGVVPAAVFLMGLFFVPESPRWLAKQGKTREALTILTRVGGDCHARKELDEIKNSVESESGSIRELFMPALRKPLIIGVLISIFAQSVGINAVIYYAPIIFMKGGDSASAALFASLIVGIINFIFTIVAVGTIDRFGRKPLLLFGLTGMMLSMLMIGAAFHPDSPGTTWILHTDTFFCGFLCNEPRPDSMGDCLGNFPDPYPRNGDGNLYGYSVCCGFHGIADIPLDD